MDQIGKRVGRSDEPISGRRPAGQTIIEYSATILRDGIMRSRFAPGQRLVESELIDQLGISRGSVREVLHLLSAEGWVTIEPFRGATVARLSRLDVRNAFAVREVIEGLAARLAAERFIKGELSQKSTKKKLRDWAKTGIGDLSTYMERNARFHGLIAELSGNPNLLPIIEQMQMPAKRTHFPFHIDRAAIDQSMREHFVVVDAICSGNAARAEKVMRQHVRRTAKLTESIPDYLFPGSAS